MTTKEEETLPITENADMVKMPETDDVDDGSDNVILRRLLVSLINGPECTFQKYFYCEGLVSYLSSYTLSAAQDTLIPQIKAGEHVLIVGRKATQQLIVHRQRGRSHVSSAEVLSMRQNNVRRFVLDENLLRPPCWT